jgi:hypothetical protein
MARRFLGLLIIPLVLMLACSSGGGVNKATGATGSDPGEQTGSGEPRAGSNGAEGEEENAVSEARMEALREARAAGTFGTAATNLAPFTATLGWTGEQLLNANFDDWEPAVAADPVDPYLYILTTRYGAPPLCGTKCPSPYLALTISDDNGATWGDQLPILGGKGSNAQYDPTIQVSADTGQVNALFLNADKAAGFSTVYMRSDDHGATWTNPVHVYTKSWTDKPNLTSSPDGQDVYASWNGQTGGDLWVATSHDHGATWTQQRITNSKRYFYAYDATVLPDGTVVFAESSVLYSGHLSQGGAPTGTVIHHAIVSTDNGDTWNNIIVDKVLIGEACVAEGCGPDYYTGQSSVATDANGDLVFGYEGPETDLGPQQVFIKTSNNGGFRWGNKTALSVVGEDATGPRVAATGNGDMRIWYDQTSGGDNPDAWNVWYRSSTDGGRSWGDPELLSDAPEGAAGYVYANGFGEIYGDYGEIDITSAGKTIAVWGEGFSYNGPGGTWYDLQT